MTDDADGDGGKAVAGNADVAGSGDEDEALRALYDASMRGAPPTPSPGVVYEQDGPLVRAVGGFRGFVFCPRDPGLRGAGLDRLIERQRDLFAGRGETVEWRVHSHDRPPELTERLRAAGFAAARRNTVLVGESAELGTESGAAPGTGRALPEGVVVRRVSGAADMRRIGAMQAAVWDMDLSWLAGFLTGRIEAAPEDVAVLAAEADGQIVSAAWMFLWPERGFAGLRGGTTLPSWRGLGVYRALVARRARIAAARGVPYLQVDATGDSLPILRRLGFRTVTKMTPYVWTPPGR
nr:GNAT family N-acetyltransferase [Streptomyces sp. DSM 40971]